MGFCGSIVGLLVRLGSFLGRFLALTSTQCNGVAPFWFFFFFHICIFNYKKKKNLYQMRCDTTTT